MEIRAQLTQTHDEHNFYLPGPNIGKLLAVSRAEEHSTMEMLMVIIVGVLGFLMAFGLAFGALDLLFSALVPMRPAFAPHAVPRRDRRRARSLIRG